MSDTTEHDIDTGAAPEGADGAEARARMMGWKPASELRVQPKGGVLTAEEFLERGERELPILRERLRNQEGQLVKVSQQLDRATEVITGLSDRFRTVDQRAYARARSDLEKERDAAIASADVREVKRLDTELRELDKTAPTAAQPPAQGVDRGCRMGAGKRLVHEASRSCAGSPGAAHRVTEHPQASVGAAEP